MNYDDVIEDENGNWAYICKSHTKEAIQDGDLDNCPIECTCGVVGCTEPAEYYLTFNKTKAMKIIIRIDGGYS